MDIFAVIDTVPLWLTLPIAFAVIILVARVLARRRSRPRRLRDGIDGTGRIAAVSTYGRNGSTQGLVTIDLVVEAPGVPATAVKYKRMIMVPRWPVPGDVVPVSLDPGNPQRCVILWGELPDPVALGEARARQLADDLRHGRGGRPSSTSTSSFSPSAGRRMPSDRPGAAATQARTREWTVRFDGEGATATGPDGVRNHLDSLDGLDPHLAQTIRSLWDEANDATTSVSFGELSSAEQKRVRDTIARLGHLFR